MTDWGAPPKVHPNHPDGEKRDEAIEENRLDAGFAAVGTHADPL